MNKKLEQEIDDKIAKVNRKANNIEIELDDLRDDIDHIKDEFDIEKLQDGYIDADECEEINTALGIIHIHNQSGNLKLQEEIDNFIERLKQKY